MFKGKVADRTSPEEIRATIEAGLMLGVWYEGNLVGFNRLEFITDEEGRKGMRAGLGNVRPDLMQKGVASHFMDGSEIFTRS